MKIEKKLKRFLQQFRNVLQRAVEQDINEADTRVLVRRILQELGYDPISELTAEFMVNQQYVDLAVKVAGDIRFFVEIKKINTRLRKEHTRQVSSYCLDKGIKWAVLTNAVHWQIYKVHSIPVERDLLAETDLLKDSIDQAVSTLLLLQKERVKSGSLEKSWEKLKAMSEENLLKALFDRDVVRAIKTRVEKSTKTPVAPRSLLDALTDLFNEKALQTIGKTISIDKLARKVERAIEKDKKREQGLPWHQACLTGTKPAAISIDGKEIAVRKWREVFIVVCNAVLEGVSTDKLEEICATVRGPKNCYFSHSQEDIRYNAFKLDCGIFAETGFSSGHIQKVLKELFTVLGQQHDSLSIKLR